MISFTRGDQRFNYRIAGVAICDGKVLLQKPAEEGFWFLPAALRCPRVGQLRTAEWCAVAAHRALQRRCDDSNDCPARRTARRLSLVGPPRPQPTLQLIRPNRGFTRDEPGASSSPLRSVSDPRPQQNGSSTEGKCALAGVTGGGETARRRRVPSLKHTILVGPRE